MKNRKSRVFKSLLYFSFLIIITAIFSVSVSAKKDSTGLYEYKVVDGTAEITEHHLDYSYEDIIIPSTLDGYTVTSIGKKAFKYSYGLTSITIPSTVTVIKEEAFYGCDETESINILGDVTSIGNRAFYYCDALESINLPDSITRIGDYAFYECNALESINLPDSITHIGDYTFYFCSSLKSINLPNGITSIGNYAFYSCESFENIYLPDSITHIGKNAFGYCDELNCVSLPQNLERLEEDLFYLVDLEKLYIPESVTYIAKDAIYEVEEIYYEGSKEYWSLIENVDIFEDDYYFEDDIPTIHFNHTHNKQKKLTKATLKQNGKAVETCDCGYYKEDFINKVSTIKLKKTEVVATGSEIKPKIVVKDSAGKTLKENVDYMATTIKPLIEPGTYDINIDFIGNYKGSKTLTLTIYSPTSQIKLNAKTVNMAIGQKATIEAKVLPATAKQGVKFASSDKNIATVSSKGVIKGIAKGTVNITITASDGKTATVKVKVYNVKLNVTKKTLNIGHQYTLKISNTSYKVSKWKTSDKKIVAINQSGLIKAKAAGQATITAVLENGIKLTCVVTVKKAALNATSMTVYVYNTKTLTLKNAATTVKWASSNTSVAKVNSKGIVTGVKAGTATITANCGGIKYTCKVTVKNQPVITVTEVDWDIDSAGGFEPIITVRNNSNKDIKYIVFYVGYKNRFGDPAYCEITGQYTQQLQVESGLYAKATNTFYWNPVIYNYNVSRMDIYKAVVTFVDNTKKTVNINSYWYDEYYYY